MPTKFSEFFELEMAAEPLDQRVYEVIGDATTIVDCYRRLYDHIIGGLKWSSRERRRAVMDGTIKLDGLDQKQMDDARAYFERDELAVPGNIVLFEYLDMVSEDIKTYGKNVFILTFGRDPGLKVEAQKACRQVRLYSKIQIYNHEYDRLGVYHMDNPDKTTPLKNGPIEIDIKAEKRIDPDDADQFKKLSEFVDDLVKWIEGNYPTLKAVLAAKTGDDLIKLVFDPTSCLSYAEKDEAAGKMLDKLGDKRIKDSNPSTRNAFGRWVIEKLEGQSPFWGNKKIGHEAEYVEIDKLKDRFTNNPSKNLIIYKWFAALFSAFLSPDAFEGESELQAETRRKTALGHMSTIFGDFKASQGSLGIKNQYDKLILKALAVVRKDARDRHTAELLEAKAPIPGNDSFKPVLPKDLADTLKGMADECLAGMPLMQGAEEVRFSTITNFEDMADLNPDSIKALPGEGNQSTVFVPSDPDENGSFRCRPIYRSFAPSILSADQAIAFCNLPNLVAGTFYYRHVNSPSLTSIADQRDRKRTLTIDFQDYTIDYEHKATGKTKNDAGQFYREAGSTVRFFEDLRTITKWTTISAVRRYDPYYSTRPTDATAPDTHLEGYVGTGKGGVRVLPLGDTRLCVWTWNSSIDFHRTAYDRMGEVLGLPMDRQIRGATPTQLGSKDQACRVTVGDTQYNYVNYGPKQFRADKFSYQIIGLTEVGKDEQFYVRVNSPSLGVAATLAGPGGPGRSRPLEDDPGKVLDLLDFGYYRRITGTKDDPSDKMTFSEDSKVIQMFSKGDKRKPSGFKAVDEWSNDKFDAIGVNLPICFNIKENVLRYFSDKRSRGKIINKGNALYRERARRDDAGTAMKPIYWKLKQKSMKDKLSDSKVPATAFADGAMAGTVPVQRDWGALKLDSRNFMPVSQEWCHLRGHGDGGEEYPGNFVSGSFHCNTEQLAIETGQRLVTQQMPESTFVLHTTAYLLRDATDYGSADAADRESQILTGSYLANQQTYQEMLENNITRKSRERSGSDGSATKKRRIDPGGDDVKRPALEQGAVAPLAAYIRYKVMRCEGGGTPGGKRSRDQIDGTRKKLFDLIFEGQSEFIDVHQFTMISQAVHFALADFSAFVTWYEQGKARLDAAKVTV